VKKKKKKTRVPQYKAFFKKIKLKSQKIYEGKKINFPYSNNNSLVGRAQYSTNLAQFLNFFYFLV
jgi:hypothetical protein